MTPTKVWIFLRASSGGGNEYVCTLPNDYGGGTEYVQHQVSGDWHALCERITQAGFTPRPAWGLPVDDDDTDIHRLAATLWANAYAGAIHTRKASEAKSVADDAVFEWRKRFYPYTLPPAGSRAAREVF